ncbi:MULTISPECIES: hypothetical protein [unclassified Streptomyces]|uniref:hypothetical protein n=1 Tax=unclassified Streptomyces TaxID=2593676 RepID=UPI002DDC6B15|nr:MULTISPECIES: hypothetical protein [unclassified Streptomyces]WSA90177.1 hypothetical protein OIE63_00500 [Streptomyces sp. NBC_01795]WSB74406.1 hypothetical protein OHB04_00500 [Streptomyces sp. NBC_01775]WSS17212.1 hypothetical protein OG533_38900 [Streptomyces sp. NBC_01186]WSS45957.1 hypothetical protein OG220_39155 [Streptomyces sp. NBC_01187]
MSAQPEHPAGPGPVPAIPHTINAIGDALSGAERARFYAEVLAAEASMVPGVMRRWWKTAMLNRAPAASASRANASAGQHLVAVDDLAAQLDEAGR